MAKNKKYQVGIIGAGAIAQGAHMPGYAGVESAEMVAFTDIAKARHPEVLEKYPQMRAYTDYREMLKNEKLDVVSVCTPNRFHATHAIAALEAGCHVLCEKPMAATLKETEVMEAAAKAAKKKLMIGFTHRLYTGTRKCKELLQQKALGKPFMIRVRFAHGGPYPGWAKDPNTFYDPKTAVGGAMLDMGIHAIDLTQWLFGPVVSVMARTETICKKIEVDDNAVMILTFQSGALGYIECGWTSKPGFLGLEIYGTEGSLICDYIKGLQMVGGKASAGADSSSEWKVIDDQPTRGGWAIELAEWIDIVAGKKKLDIDAAVGRSALAVALAAYKSSKTGKAVSIV